MMKKISHRVGYSYGRSRRAVVSFVSFSVLALMFLAASGRELLFTPSLAVAAASGQSDNGASLWKDVEEKSIPNPANRSVIPRKYRTLSLNTQGLEELLKGVPLERPGLTGGVTIALPMPDGSFARFQIVESPIMEPGLARQFPEFKTYRGQGIDDPSATMRFIVTPLGFHAIILSAAETVLLDPYSKDDADHYISYRKQDLEKNDEGFFCSAKAAPKDKSIEPKSMSSQGTQSFSPIGATLRSYRLAVASTVEFTAATGGTQMNKQPTIDAIALVVNHVNAIYEREIAVRLVLVSSQQESLIIFTGADGYTNGIPTAMKVENQEIIDNALGSGAYDIGHVFGTSGGSGGEASIPAACISGDKAEGASVTSLPIVSIFEIEVVAHEIGHQLGANHTFNGTSIACGAQRTPGSAYEPGAGSTIMAYVHKCFPEDLQPANDAYFHSRSIEQISDHIGAAGSCAVSTSTGNSAPVVEAGPNYTIPKATPFTLTAAGSDPNGDPVFYSWEQYDLGGAGPPDNDSDGQGKPIFRSFPATLSSSRAFPSLANILDYGNVPPALLVIDSHFYMPGESLPLISRTMTFRVTARDFRSGGGGVSSDEMQVTVDGSSEPFFVTTPTTPTVWAAGIPHTVTWNVGSTSVAPINCSTVRILLSTDGGLTFPPNLILSSGTANDGSEDITVPTNVSSSEARIKVEAVSNIFFDVSDTNFIIPAGTCAYSINLSVSTPNVNAQSKSFNVSTTGSCDWVARSNVDWITFQPGNPVNRIQGSGSATITFQVTSNANGAKRTGTISIGGLTHTVTQDGGTFTSSISPLSNTFTFNAGSGAIAVSMDPNSFWYAFSSDPWISIVSGKSGRGPGNIIFSVARNVSASQRTGSLKVGAQTFSVTQGAFNSATTLKLSGTIFGTPGAFQPGSERDKAYDGNVQTYFDADLANANGAYTGIDLGSGNAKKIVKIRFFPRSDFVGGPDRMVGGKFQGSNSSESTGFVDLYTIPFAPAISSWVELTITDPTTFRYLRYLSPNGGFCNVAEVEFYTDTGAPPSNNAAFVSQNVPASMTASQSYSVSVTMSNTGTTTWTVVTYYLGSQNPQGNTTWGLNQVNLTTSVPPNSQAVFNFSVTAPSTAGTYNFQWQMANGAGVFGAPSTNVVVTVSTSGSPVKLTGTAFGTSPPFQAGREFDKAVDGNTSTYFDFSVGDGGYAGIDLGAGNGKSVVKIRYYPRSDFAGGPDRMVGGKFQGSNTSSSSGYVDLHTVTTAPPIGTWIEVTISNPTTFRYLRYLGPNGSYCNVAEIEFYTPAPPKLTGTAFGTSPPWQAGREFDKAVDGNTSTYFDFSVSDGGYTGIDLGAGNGKSVVKIRYYPRSDFAGGPDRMVGGKFQGSNTSSSSGYVDLHTITTAPPIGTWIEVIISNPTTFRYLRYLGANGSFCNVAEIEFYGN